ncbi:MAG: nuclear transport factor 2 family protein [Clostridia bacterium]|nr:nuclear transport factor 2 family protein [Clostridia bacterium]
MNIEIVKKFWEYIDKAEFDKLRVVMEDNANVILPNTREIFRGCENYIEFNRDYPGRWHAEIEKIAACDNFAVSAVKVFNDEGISLYVTSFFKVSDGKIDEITEYWGENGEVPEWRIEKGYSEKY